MVSAIFPAAGQGKRMHLGLNKAFLELAGQPMLVRTLKRFSEVEEVGELIVVVGADEIIDTRRLLASTSGLKPYKVVEGGSERQYSVYNGLQCVAEAADIVLVHDAARPLGSRETILRCHPDLLVSAYHRSEDLYDLPLLLHEQFPFYELRLRRFPYVPAWDINLYATVPSIDKGKYAFRR